MTRVLIVDDDLAVQRSLGRCLSQAGYDVVTTTKPDQALALGGPFDVYVLDIDLGHRCGVELAQKLLHRGKQGSIFFFTGNLCSSTLERAQALGQVISKELGLSGLRAALDAFARDESDSD